MLTETEKRALQLAKRVFEHFTHDSLPIAREILLLEEQLSKDPANEEPRAVQTPVTEAKKVEGGFVPKPVSTIHLPPHALDLPDGIMMGSRKEASMATLGVDDDQMPF